MYAIQLTRLELNRRELGYLCLLVFNILYLPSGYSLSLQVLLQYIIVESRGQVFIKICLQTPNSLLSLCLV